MYWNIGKQKNQANGNILAGSQNSAFQKKIFTTSCVPGALGGESRMKRSIRLKIKGTILSIIMVMDTKICALL